MGDAYDGASCLHCGSAWFTIGARPEDEGPIVGVCLDRDGHITGYTGMVSCLECGQAWEPRPQLRLVCDG